MVEVELLTDLYEALLRLRYPGIAKVHSKDFKSVTLTGSNRISLLSWLLARSSEPLASALGTLKDNALEAEVLKHYSQMGICNDRNILLGTCAFKNQIDFLQLLLLLINNVNPVESNASDNISESAVSEMLEKLNKESINIIPPLCSISSKLDYSEANKYFEDIKKSLSKENLSTVQCQSSTIETLPVTEKEISSNCKTTNSDKDLSMVASVEKFTETFNSVSTWAKFASLDSAVNRSNCMDEDIQNIQFDFSSINQALESKEAVSSLTIPRKLNKVDAPLNQIIEEIVIGIEQVSSLYQDDNVN